jgi:hypothetical protein
MQLRLRQSAKCRASAEECLAPGAPAPDAWCAGRRRGEEVAIQDGRPSGELLLATGALEDDNPADCLSVQARPRPRQRTCPLSSRRRLSLGPQAAVKVS